MNDYQNCLYHPNGCRVPWDCPHCGFDKKEAERRKHIPLTPNYLGLLRKNIGRDPSTASGPSPLAGEARAEGGTEHEQNEH